MLPADKVPRRAVLGTGLGASLALAGAAGSAAARPADGSTPAMAPTILTVAPDGSADHPSPKAACAAIVASGTGGEYLVDVAAGTYTDTEWEVPANTTIRGRDRETCILQGSLPDSANDGWITYTSTLWLKQTATLENLTITARNMRYAVHSEDSGANVDASHTVRNCRIEHFGNDGARQWRRDHPESGMSPDTVWSSDRPWGYGSASGVRARFVDSTFAGTGAPWYVHTNKDFARPNQNELINCELVVTADVATRSVLAVQALGSGQPDTVTLRDCRFVGSHYIKDDDRPWISKLPERQVADHAEISLRLDDCSPVGYLSMHRGRALRLSSATGLLIEVAGTAVPVLFGEVSNRIGGGGLPSQVVGQWDISGILVGLNSNVQVANTLGRRLGDCRTTPLVLDVTTGGVTRSVTFDQDHRGQTNSVVLSQINAGLTSEVRADEYDVVDGEHYPHFTDREAIRINAGTVGIPRWAAIRASGGGVAAMAEDDPVELCVGVAIEPIPPSHSGRVLSSGIFHRRQLPGLAAADLTQGTVVSLGSALGSYVIGEERPIGVAVVDGWVRIDVSTG